MPNEDKKRQAADRLFRATITGMKSHVGVEHFRAYPFTDDGIEKSVKQRDGTTAFNVLNGIKRRYISLDGNLAPAVTDRSYHAIQQPFSTESDVRTMSIGNMFQLDELVKHIRTAKDIETHFDNFYSTVAGRMAVHFADFLDDFAELNNARLKDS